MREAHLLSLLGMPAKSEELFPEPQSPPTKTPKEQKTIVIENLVGVSYTFISCTRNSLDRLPISHRQGIRCHRTGTSTPF